MERLGLIPALNDVTTAPPLPAGQSGPDSAPTDRSQLQPPQHLGQAQRLDKEPALPSRDRLPAQLVEKRELPPPLRQEPVAAGQLSGAQRLRQAADRLGSAGKPHDFAGGPFAEFGNDDVKTREEKLPPKVATPPPPAQAEREPRPGAEADQKPQRRDEVILGEIEEEHGDDAPARPPGAVAAGGQEDNAEGEWQPPAAKDDKDSDAAARMPSDEDEEERGDRKQEGKELVEQLAVAGPGAARNIDPRPYSRKPARIPFHPAPELQSSKKFMMAPQCAGIERPHPKILYIKTHKTGSSTLANILNRLTIKYG